MGKKTMKMKRMRQKFKNSNTLERAKEQSELQQEVALHSSLKAIVDNDVDVNENDSENEREDSSQPSPRPLLPHSSHPSAASLLLVVPEENFTTSSPSRVQRKQMKHEYISDHNLDFSAHTLSSLHRPRSGRRPNHQRMISVDDGTLFRQAFTVSVTK